MSIHTGGRPHTYSAVCDNTFIARGDLNKQVPIHTGDLPVTRRN